MAIHGPVNEEALIQAAAKGALDEVALIIVRLREASNPHTALQVQRALLWAAACGHQDVVSFFISPPQNEMITSQDILSALKKAIIYQRDEVRNLLLTQCQYDLLGPYLCEPPIGVCEQFAVLVSNHSSIEAQEHIEVYIPNFQRLKDESFIPPEAGFLVGSVFCKIPTPGRKI